MEKKEYKKPELVEYGDLKSSGSIINNSEAPPA